MAKYKFEIDDLGGQYAWSLKGTNGKLLAEGSGYSRIGSLMNMLETIFGNSSPLMDLALEKMRLKYT